MSQDVEVTFSAKDQGVIAYLQKQQAEVLKNQEKLVKLGLEGRKAGKLTKEGAAEAADSLGMLAQRLTAVVTGGAAATATFRLLNREFQNAKEFSKDAMVAQFNRAGAVRNAAFALGTDPTMNPQQMETALEGISRRTGVDVKDLATGAADVLSARGDQSPAMALQALESAARLAPDQPGNLGTFAAAALDIVKGTGQTPDQALGQILSVGSQSRVTSLQGITQNIAPGLIGLTKFGDDPRAAGALIAAVSQGGVDATGATSRTSSISLAAQLEEFLPALKSTSERIAAVQGDEQLRSRFLDSASFEKQFIPTARGLLSGDATTPERRSYAAAMEAIKQGPDAEVALRETLRGINELESVRTQRLDMAVKSTEERLRSASTLGAQGGVSRQGLESLLKAAGASATTQALTMSDFELSTQAGTMDPVGFLEQRLRSRANDLIAAPLPAGGAGMGPANTSILNRDFRPSAINVSRSEELTVLADLLRDILAEQKAANNRPQVQPPLRDPGAPPRPRASSALAK